MNQEGQRISKEEVAMKRMKGMKSGEAVGQDYISVEVWRCL